MDDESKTNFDKIPMKHWARASFITSQKFFKVTKCDESGKITLLCVACEQNGTEKTVTGYLKTCSNLKNHIEVSS